MRAAATVCSLPVNAVLFILKKGNDAPWNEFCNKYFAGRL